MQFKIPDHRGSDSKELKELKEMPVTNLSRGSQNFETDVFTKDAYTAALRKAAKPPVSEQEAQRQIKSPVEEK